MMRFSGNHPITQPLAAADRKLGWSAHLHVVDNNRKNLKMPRLLSFLCLALLIGAQSVAHAQTSGGSADTLATGETKTLTDVRIAVVKNALQLTPDQAKYWPAIEEAIKSRAEARRERLSKLGDRVRGEQRDSDFIQVLQQRADNLSQRGASLKRLADAWQPLYGTLSEDQKHRMRILGVLVLHGLSERMEARREEMEDEEGGDPTAATGSGSGESGRSR